MNQNTPAQKKLILLLRLWVVLFGLAGASFYLIPDQLFTLLNTVSQKFFPSAGLNTHGTDRFWLSLCMSLMVTLTFICYMAQKNIEANLGLVLALLVSKFASTLFFFMSFMIYDRLGAYLIGLLTDGIIFLITYAFYQRVRREYMNSHFDTSTAPNPTLKGGIEAPLSINPEHTPALRPESRRVDKIDSNP